MKGQNMLKVLSVMMIFVCIFGVSAGAFGVLNLKTEKSNKQSDKAAAEAQLTELEMGLSQLDADFSEYEAASSYLEENEAEYLTTKDAFDFSMTVLDKKAADFAAANEAGLLDNATSASTQAQIETLKAELEIKRASLEQYEAIRKNADDYEAAKAKIEASLLALSQEESIRTKILGGMDTIAAAKEALREDTAKTSAYLQNKFYINIGIAAIALLILIEAFMGLSAANIPSLAKIRGGVFFGVISFIFAAAAIVFCEMNDYNLHIILISALAVETIFSLFYLITVNNYKKALLELIAD